MKIYAISGLGADERVFNYLNLNAELICIEWIKPLTKECIIEYSKRLIEQYDLYNQDDICILGVSFGGLVATEISKLIQPRFSIIIASMTTKDNLSNLFKIIGKTNIINWIPKVLLDPPRVLAYYFFGAKNKSLLNDILDDSDLYFTRWAIREVLNWSNETEISPVLRIDAENDKLFPHRNENSVLIKNGGHFIIVDNGLEISTIINDALKGI